MDKERKGLAIILHSGSYDRIYHGLSIASTALALGREVKLFFTYWTLEYLRRVKSPALRLDKESEDYRAVIENSIERGHMKEISKLLADAKEIGARLYACVSSMAFLNITRDELVDEVDESTGIATFLMETENDQLLFV
jgi:peroxiredoxin family protein